MRDPESYDPITVPHHEALGSLFVFPLGQSDRNGSSSHARCQGEDVLNGKHEPLTGALSHW